MVNFPTWLQNAFAGGESSCCSASWHQVGSSLFSPKYLLAWSCFAEGGLTTSMVRASIQPSIHLLHLVSLTDKLCKAYHCQLKKVVWAVMVHQRLHPLTPQATMLALLLWCQGGIDYSLWHLYLQDNSGLDHMGFLLGSSLVTWGLF